MISLINHDFQGGRSEAAFFKMKPSQLDTSQTLRLPAAITALQVSASWNKRFLRRPISETNRGGDSIIKLGFNMAYITFIRYITPKLSMV